MPREIVRSCFFDALNINDDVQSFVQVGWSREGFVQIATVAPKGAIAPWDDEQQRHVIADVHDPGWWIDLDRHGINNLIRLLRKARDAAFGKDE
jgi:hypothetical protein